MSSKSQLVEYIQSHFGDNTVMSANSSFASINKSKEVWWLNIPVGKFEEQVNLLLQGENKVIWIQLPKNFVGNLTSKFKIREDKNAVDLEISSDRSYLYLKDVKSGGTHFDFKPFVKEQF
ncbi:hypothetical protein [uncultured Christiangramia sp.]|uniref:hypothetical protein n=1 Tax=uncultured Christiangramia sp. TaxID=503836 RepID=UPI00260B0E16|nr:hypothetical protein [uncultured Christiangramia sp.]